MRHSKKGPCSFSLDFFFFTRRKLYHQSKFRLTWMNIDETIPRFVVRQEGHILRLLSTNCNEGLCDSEVNSKKEVQ